MKAPIARTAAWVLVALTAVSSTGCVGLIAPPVRASFTGGIAGGHVVTTLRHSDGSPEAGQPITRTPLAATELRIEFAPQQLVHSQFHRRWEIGGGYGYTQFYGLRFRGLSAMGGYHSVFAHAAVFPWLSSTTSNVYGRWGVHLDLDLPVADDTLQGRLGVGATVATTLEFVGFAHTSWAKGDWIAGAGQAALGEGGMGLRIAMSAYEVDGQSAWMATAGITVQLPAYASIAYAPIPVVVALGAGLAGLK